MSEVYPPACVHRVMACGRRGLMTVDWNEGILTRDCKTVDRFFAPLLLFWNTHLLTIENKYCLFRVYQCIRKIMEVSTFFFNYALNILLWGIPMPSTCFLGQLVKSTIFIYNALLWHNMHIMCCNYVFICPS